MCLDAIAVYHPANYLTLRYQATCRSRNYRVIQG